MLLRQEQSNFADEALELSRLRRLLLDRKSVLTQLRFKISSLTAVRDSAV